MKVTSYKCDVCGQSMNTNPDGVLCNLSVEYGGNKHHGKESAQVEVSVKSKSLSQKDDPNNVDICHRCIRHALLDKIQTDLNPF